jgi:hypothetical protein
MFGAEHLVQLRRTYFANNHEVLKSFTDVSTPLTPNYPPVATNLPATTETTRFCYYRFLGESRGLIARNRRDRRELRLPITA